MSATTIALPIEKLIQKEKYYTAEDYYRLTPPDNSNYELHNGKIIFMPSPLLPHQKLSNLLSYYLTGFVLKNSSGIILAAPMDVEFDKKNVIQPDLLFISNDRMNIVENNRKIKGAPDLVVEILSEGNTAKAMNDKKFVFENHFVTEYWLINLEKRQLIQYENSDIGFVPRAVLTQNDTLKSLVLLGFELNLSEVFD